MVIAITAIASVSTNHNDTQRKQPRPKLLLGLGTFRGQFPEMKVNVLRDTPKYGKENGVVLVLNSTTKNKTSYN